MNGEARSGCFVDTNVLVYARDASEPDKQPLAMRWMEALWRSRQGRLSFQVLTEFYVTVTQKLQPGLSTEAAQRDVRSFLKWEPLAVDETVLEAAWSVQMDCSVSWWDALIVAAAKVQGCSILLSEDLNEGQTYGGVRVVNPFTTSPLEAGLAA